MANIDGGHYFLTTLIPVRNGPVQRADGSFTVPSHKLREALASLPTAQQSPASVKAGFSSPFSRCTRTHFARAVVIDQPMYNGRDGGNALVQALRRINLLAQQPVDNLSRPYLMFNADFDAREGEADGGLASWAAGLWVRTEPELRAMFEACVGFDQVNSGAAFAGWLKRCQLETTMSFNDYYVPTATFEGYYTLAGWGKGVAIGTGLLILLAVWAGLALHCSAWWLLLAIPAAALIGIASGLAVLWHKGSQPFPTGAHTDLPSILKALHVQQRFALLAAELQGADASTVHRRFGEFVQQVQPAQVSAPTQAPGVIRSDGVELVTHKQVLQKAMVA